MKNILSIFLILLSLSACDNAETKPSNPNENEVLTTVQLVFSEKGTLVADTFTFRSADGAVFGRNAIQDTIKLKPDAVYGMFLKVLDESKAKPVEITPAIVTEGIQHQFFYTSAPDSLIVTNYATLNKDKNNLPLGTIVGSITTQKTRGSGTYTVELIHQPNKDGEGVISGDKTNAAGTTDISVSFPVVVR